jgi:hypothetical protein
MYRANALYDGIAILSTCASSRAAVEDGSGIGPGLDM